MPVERLIRLTYNPRRVMRGSIPARAHAKVVNKKRACRMRQQNPWSLYMSVYAKASKISCTSLLVDLRQNSNAVE
jgi:hypothetical protein